MVTVSVRMRKDLHHQLKEYASKTGETMGEVVERALRVYLTEHEKKPEQEEEEEHRGQHQACDSCELYRLRMIDY